MSSNLVMTALTQAYYLRSPQYGCVFHSDRGSQYTSKAFQQLLDNYNMRSSMSDVGCCYDNAVVERFFGSLKHERIYPCGLESENSLYENVADYIHYYNLKRPHTTNGGLPPINFENSHLKVSVAA